MKNKEYIHNIINKIGQKNVGIMGDLITLQQIDSFIELIEDEYLKTRLKDEFSKIGVDYGNLEINDTVEVADVQ